MAGATGAGSSRSPGRRLLEAGSSRRGRVEEEGQAVSRGVRGFLSLAGQEAGPVCLCSPHPLHDARSLEEGERKTVSPGAKPRHHGRQWGDPESKHPGIWGDSVWLLRDNGMGWPRAPVLLSDASGPPQTLRTRC